MDAPPERKRRPRYAGKHPRKFHEKYKELNADRYASDIEKIVASGKTPAGMHRPIMVAEVLRLLAPEPGNIAVDCTLGFGGHARAILERILPGGRLIGLDVDPMELPRSESRLRAAGFGAGAFVAHRSNFAGLPQVLAKEDVAGADLVLADLGVSSMQLDNPERGFTYKDSGPLDMRMNPSRGEPASRLLARLTMGKLVRMLQENADEPHAEAIAETLKRQSVATTEDLCRGVRAAVLDSDPRAGKREVDTSIRRTFQALRIAVNDEFSALDALLRTLPLCLAPGGRVAILTFHSGEDRRVKKAFEDGRRDGSYSAIAADVLRPSAGELRANPRVSSAKLRWAIREGAPPIRTSSRLWQA
jgi:16S rRNA (cytosine1402-N4)-methyltransferase